MARTNFSTNPNLETGVAGHTVGQVRSGQTVSHAAGAAPGWSSSVAAAVGTNYAFVNLTGDGTSPTGTAPDVSRRHITIAVSPGQTWALSVAAAPSLAGPNARAVMVFLDAGGTAVAAYASPAITPPAGQWTRAGLVSVVPAGATQMRVELWWVGVADTTQRTLRDDAWLIEQTDSTGPYFDGATGPGYAWTGTAHASTSTGPDLARTVPVATGLETDIAPAVARRRARLTGPVGETNQVRPVNRRPGEVRPAAEDNTHAPLGRARGRAVGALGEGDAVPGPLARARTRALGAVGESNTVPPPARRRRRALAAFATVFEAMSPVFRGAVVDDRAWAEAIESAERLPVVRLRADWRRDGQFAHPLSDLTPLLQQVSVDRNLAGGLPAEVGLVEGFVSAALKATLAGRWGEQADAAWRAAGPDTPWAETGMSPAEAFSAYRRDSPLAGVPVLRTPLTLDTGFITDDGPRFDRRFTGTLAAASPASATRQVTIDGLDPASRMRTKITQPAAAQYSSSLARRGPSVYRSRFNTQWVIDRALRAQGYYASPPFRDDAVLGVTLHGSPLPERGWGGAPQEVYTSGSATASWVTGGPHGMMCPRYSGPTTTWWTTRALTATTRSGIGMSCLLSLGPDHEGVQRTLVSAYLTSNGSVRWEFGIAATGVPYTGLRVGETLYFPTPNAALPTTRQFVYFGAHLAIGRTSMAVTYRLDGQTYTGTIPIPERAVTSWAWVTYVYADLRESMTNFSMWSSYAAPGTTGGGQWVGEDHVSMADIDPGANELTGMPELVAVDPLDLIREVSAAELAEFGVSETGRPAWRTRRGKLMRIRPSRPVRERITAERNLSELVATTAESSIRNVVTATCVTQLVGPWRDVITAEDVEQFDTPARTTRIFELPLPGTVYELPNEGGVDSVRFDKAVELRASYARSVRYMTVRLDNGELAGFDGVTVRVFRPDPWRIRIAITNSYSYGVRFASPAWTETENDDGTVTRNDAEPKPTLIVPARAVEKGEDEPIEVSDPGSVRTYGPTGYDMPGAGAWRQWAPTVRPTLDAVLAFTANPIPTFAAHRVPHDPRRRVGAEAVLVDPDGLGEIVVRHLNINTAIGDGGATDQLTERPIAPPGAGLLDDPELGLPDTTLYPVP